MPTTVHFVTNQFVSGPAGQVGSYGNTIVAPNNLGYLTYSSAFLGDAGFMADTVCVITSI